MPASLQKATLDEIRNAAARICRDYLTGRWKVVMPEQLIVKRISGGLSNFLYYVSLPEQADDEDDVTAEQLSGNNTNRAVAAEIVSTTADVIASAMATTVGVSSVRMGNVGAYDKNSNAQHATKRHQNTQPEQQQLQKEHEQQQQQHDIFGGIGTGVPGVNANIGIVGDLTNEIATKSSHKRQRIDSDSGDSSSSKRLQAMKKEPREVLLRIYGQTHGDDALESMITESVVFALLSERNFGPKLHGIFPGGRIEQYIPARSLTTLELSDHRLSMKIAEKMGEIHSLNIPMSKEPDWIWNCMKRWLRSLDSICNVAVESKPNSAVLLKQRELMRTIDYVKEMKWLKSVIEQGDYVVRFCHNDLQEGNILLRQTPVGQDGSSPRPSISSLRSNFDETLGDSLDGNGNLELETNTENKVNSTAISSSPCVELDTTDDSALDASFTTDNEPDLIIIDFEYCAYNYRGFDLANHFAEWTFDYTNPEFPYFYHYKEQYSNAQQRRDFIVTYLKKYLDDDDYEPTEQELVGIDEEVKLFTMFSHLFWSLWSVVNVTSTIEFGYWDYAVARIMEYQQLKAAYLAERP